MSVEVWRELKARTFALPPLLASPGCRHLYEPITDDVGVGGVGGWRGGGGVGQVYKTKAGMPEDLLVLEKPDLRVPCTAPD